MTPQQYHSARLALGWTHQRVANVLGVHRRSCQRYVAGEVDIPEPAARLLLLLVRLRLTMSADTFEEIVNELSNSDA